MKTETKQSCFRAWKSGKRWIYAATTLTAVVAGGLLSSNLTAHAATATSTTTIDQVTNADKSAGLSSGTIDTRAAVVNSGSWNTFGSAKVQPINFSMYFQKQPTAFLVQTPSPNASFAGQQNTGAMTLNQQIDMTKSFDINGIWGQQSYGPLILLGTQQQGMADGFGFILTPTLPKDLNINRSGPLLGIGGTTESPGGVMPKGVPGQGRAYQGTPDTNYIGTNFTDYNFAPMNYSNTGHIGAFKIPLVGKSADNYDKTTALNQITMMKTNSKGNFIANETIAQANDKTIGGAGYANNEIHWDNAGYQGVNVTLKWDVTKVNNDGTTSGTLSFIWDTTVGKTEVISKKVTLKNAQTLGMVGAFDGSQSGQLSWGPATYHSTSTLMAAMRQIHGTQAASTVKVNYLDQNGKVIKAATSLTQNTGETLGIKGVSQNAGKDTIALNAPSIAGYRVLKANDVTVQQDTAQNVVNIYYVAQSQKANFNYFYQANTPGTTNITLDTKTAGKTTCLNSTPYSITAALPAKTTINNVKPAPALPKTVVTTGNTGATINAVNFTLPSGYVVGSAVTPEGKVFTGTSAMQQAVKSHSTYLGTSNNFLVFLVKK